MPKPYAALVATLLACCLSADAQRLTVGAVVGTSLTGDVVTNYTPFFLPFPPYAITDIQRSGGRRVIGGASLEWRFSPHFALEGDAIYRVLNYEDRYGGNHNPTITIELPILAKYRFDTGRIRPFLEGGPSFRTTGNRNIYPSHYGWTAGAGFDLPTGPMTFSPALRYTRWARDSVSPGVVQSRPDQIEILLGVTPTLGKMRGFSKHVLIGALLGTNLLNDVSPQYYGFGFGSVPNGRTLLVGPTLEFTFTKSFSLEVGFLYRPVRFRNVNVSGGTEMFLSAVENTTWEFPVLVKYKLPLLQSQKSLRPFVESGPTFRSPTGSTFGWATGAGVEWTWKWFHLSPELRYARWQRGNIFDHYKPDKLDVLVGFSF